MTAGMLQPQPGPLLRLESVPHAEQFDFAIPVAPAQQGGPVRQIWIATETEHSLHDSGSEMETDSDNDGSQPSQGDIPLPLAAPSVVGLTTLAVALADY